MNLTANRHPLSRSCDNWIPKVLPVSMVMFMNAGTVSLRSPVALQLAQELHPTHHLTSGAGNLKQASVHSAAAAEENRQLVADQFAATVGEDRRPVGEARALLLTAAGGKPFNAAAVRGDGATDCRLTGGDGVDGDRL